MAPESLFRLVHPCEESTLSRPQREEARCQGRTAHHGPGASGMNIAFCYESVLPARGGCETYIADLARRLVADGHEVHLYACRWDEDPLPRGMHFHQLSLPRGPRFLRPWRFGAACERALREADHQLTLGFDKTST